MEDLNYKANVAFYLSLLSLLVAFVVIGCWYFGTFEMAVVTPETFIGITVALLAIIVTIAIGWQIWAAMDLKSNIAKLDSRIQEIENLKKQFGQQQEEIKQLSLKNRHLTSYTWGKYAYQDKKWLASFRYLILSLSSSLQLESPLNVEQILTYLSKISNKINTRTKCKKKFHTEIVNANKKIRSLRNFSLIEERYKESYDKIIAKIEIDDEN